jgi:hypothetical protein
MTATVQFIIVESKDVLRVSNSAVRFRATDDMLAAWRKQRESADPDSTGDRGSRGSGTGRGDGARRASKAGPPDRAMLWTLDEDGKPTVVFAQAGITDGQYTEVAGRDVREGMQVIASIVKGSATSSASNPFQGEQPSLRRGPPGL